jgi:hypothetical protein
MIPRPLARTRREALAALLALGTLGAAGGCDPRALFYFLQPMEPTIKPPCPSLKGKKVVILTHSAMGTSAVTPTLDKDLSVGLARIMEEKVKKVEIVPHDRVQTWVDSHPGYTDPAEAGLAFDADSVIFLEITDYAIDSPLSPGLFQGSSKVHVKVYDLLIPTDEKGRTIDGQPREVKVIHDDYVESTFPRVQGSLPQSATVNRSLFAKKFFEVVLAEVSWHFVPHASGDDIQDTNF